MTGRRKVLIVDHVPDMLELFQFVMSDLGYETATVLANASVLEEARRLAPDLIILDLLPTNGNEWALLDRFRVETITQGVPVVAVSTSPSLLEQAVASYNVRQVILKPFNLDDLERKVRAALESSPLIKLLKPTTVPLRPLFSVVATGVAAESRAIMIRWVQQISASESFRNRQLGLADLIDHVPLLLEATLASLQVQDYRGLFKQDSPLWERAADHARMRRGQGIPLRGVVLEYQFLRNEIWCAVAGVLMGKTATALDILDIVTRMDFVLDSILTVTIGVYEDASQA